MVGFNPVPGLLGVPAFLDLHSIMVGFNPGKKSVTRPSVPIYIPLWSDSIMAKFEFLNDCIKIYIPLWSDSILNSDDENSFINRIYIPLWSDSISRSKHFYEPRALHLHSIMVGFNRAGKARSCLCRRHLHSIMVGFNR